MNKRLLILVGAIIIGSIIIISSIMAVLYNPISTVKPGDRQEVLNDMEYSRDKPSPSNKIDKSQILVLDDQVIIKLNNPRWAVFTGTKSMDPVIDSTSKAIEVIPKSSGEIGVGDIVAYKSNYSDGIITHRVIEVGSDDFGWFAKMKGDNNDSADPEKVRFGQIRRIVVAIIY